MSIEQIVFKKGTYDESDYQEVLKAFNQPEEIKKLAKIMRSIRSKGKFGYELLPKDLFRTFRNFVIAERKPPEGFMSLLENKESDFIRDLNIEAITQEFWTPEPDKESAEQTKQESPVTSGVGDAPKENDKPVLEPELTGKTGEGPETTPRAVAESQEPEPLVPGIKTFSRKSLGDYISNKPAQMSAKKDKGGVNTHEHKPAYRLFSSKTDKLTIAQGVIDEIIAANDISLVSQLVKIREAIRKNEKATGILSTKGELHDILIGMQAKVVAELDKHPRDRAIAELKDYITVIGEEKKGRVFDKDGQYRTNLEKKQNLAKDMLAKLITKDEQPVLMSSETLGKELEKSIAENKKMTVPTPFKESRLGKIFEDLKVYLPGAKKAADKKKPS